MRGEQALANSVFYMLCRKTQSYSSMQLTTLIAFEMIVYTYLCMTWLYQLLEDSGFNRRNGGYLQEDLVWVQQVDDERRQDSS